MPVPFACPLRLTDDERQSLESLVRAHSTPQAFAFRCRLILRAAAPEAPPNLRGAADMHCHRQTVRLWRTRYLTHGRAGLQEAPRPGRPRRFSPLGAHRCPVTRDEYAGRPPPPSDALEP
jgi:winged helix-turn helix protein